MKKAKAMWQFFQTKEFWAAIIGAAATIGAVGFAVWLGLRRLRDTEIARLRIKCVIDLAAYRFFLTSPNDFSAGEKIPFLSALNAIPGLFGANDKVMRHLRDYREESAGRKNAALFLLIREAAAVSKIPLSSVSNIDLENPFIHSASNKK